MRTSGAQREGRLRIRLSCDLAEIPKEAEFGYPSGQRCVPDRGGAVETACGKELRLKDRVHGNNVLFLELGPRDGRRSRAALRGETARKGSLCGRQAKEGEYLNPTKRSLEWDLRKIVPRFWQASAANSSELAPFTITSSTECDIKSTAMVGSRDAYTLQRSHRQLQRFSLLFHRPGTDSGIPARFAIGVAILLIEKWWN